MRRVEAAVRARRHLTADIVSLELSCPGLARRAAPGQFVHVRTGRGSDPLLRRPISIADVRGDRLRLVFRVVGRGTALLARLRNGATLDMLGPLGRPAPEPGRRTVFLCGGGVGAAPLLFLARKLAPRHDVRAYLGARRGSDLILVSDFRRFAHQVVVASDDWSRGWHGPVTEPVCRDVERARDPVVYACGPRPMLAALVARLDPVPVWGFVEERMGCGTGICYCCALPRRGGGYVRFCQEGPVVRLNEVEL